MAAMISYKGEWYWGVDRLPYLEAELAADLGVDVAHVVTPRTDRGPLKLSDKPLTCELWFSFRSPYSYLALEQIETVLAPYKVPLVLRQVQPMVARGAQLPNVKRMYIVRDAKREADRLGIAFGEVCDPLGKGVDHCLAIQHWANQRGPAEALAFARSAMRGAWSEAKDLGEYVDLKVIVERAGLPWEEAKAVLEDPAAAKQATVNAQDMAVIGLWGVPSFRCGDFVAWGQDRLPLLADRLRRHALAQSVVQPAG
jgi:2-hydroxychromene-2-carboxylate isomerase